MNEKSAHKSFLRSSEAMFFPALLIAIVLEVLWPTRFDPPFVAPLRVAIGVLFLGAGIGVIVWAKKTLSASGQPTKPGAPTTELVTAGPFKYSRNPLYLGDFSIFLGVAFTFDTLWLLPLVAISAGLTHYFLIMPEENYLETLFGDTYREYAREVRRWI